MESAVDHKMKSAGEVEDHLIAGWILILNSIAENLGRKKLPNCADCVNFPQPEDLYMYSRSANVDKSPAMRVHTTQASKEEYVTPINVS